MRALGCAVVLCGAMVAVLPAAARTQARAGTIVFATTSVPHWAAPDVFVVDGAGPRRNVTRSPADAERDPDWSPNGMELAFSRRDAVGTDLFVRTAAGTEVRVTNDPDPETLPKWSPDGTAIAFARGASSRQRLWVMRRDNSSQRLRSETPAELLDASWSRDGSRIVLVENRRLHVLDVATAARIPVPSDQRSILAVFWRSDARILYVTEKQGGGFRVASVMPGEQGVREEPNPCGIDFPTWSSDGRHAFCSVYASTRLTRVVTAAGALVRRLVLAPRNEGLLYSGFSLAAGGARLAFAAYAEEKDFDLAEWEPARGTVRVLRVEPADDISPTVAPGGRRIAFIRAPYQGGVPAQGRGELVVYDRATRRLRRLAARASDPSWSPDGRRIVFASADDLFIVTVASRIVTRLTRGKPRDADPAWSPDGRRIAFMREDRLASLAVIDVATGRTRVLESEAAEMFDPAWSPDGKWIAWADIATLHVISTETLRSRRRYRDNDNTISSPSWSPDGRRIVFSKGWQFDLPDPWDAPTGHDRALFVVDVAGRSPPRRLTNGPGWEADPAWGR